MIMKYEFLSLPSLERKVTTSEPFMRRYSKESWLRVDDIGASEEE
jgi:hypothetical protein